MTSPSLRKRRLGALIAACALMPALSACVYRMTVQQGNYLEKHSVEQLQVGMTRVQVRYLLGTPMMPSMFDNDRWDYLYYLRVGREQPIQRQLTVYFKDDKVARIDEYGRDPSMPTEPHQRAPDPLL